MVTFKIGSGLTLFSKVESLIVSEKTAAICKNAALLGSIANSKAQLEHEILIKRQKFLPIRKGLELKAMRSSIVRKKGHKKQRPSASSSSRKAACFCHFWP